MNKELLLEISREAKEDAIDTVRRLNSQFDLGIRKQQIESLRKPYAIMQRDASLNKKKAVVPYFFASSLNPLLECLRYQLNNVGINMSVSSDLLNNLDKITLRRQSDLDGFGGLVSISFIPGGIERFNSHLAVEVLWLLILYPEIVCNLQDKLLLIPGAIMRDKRRTCVATINAQGSIETIEARSINGINVARTIIPVPYSVIS